MKWFAPLAMIAISESIADVLSKEWSLQPRPWLAAVAVLTYVCAALLWLVALRKGAGLARGAVVLSVASLCLSTTIGVAWYREPISRSQGFGLAAGLIAVVLLAWE